MINYLSKFNYLSIKLITCQNKLITDQRMIDYMCQNCLFTATYYYYYYNTMHAINVVIAVFVATL